MQLGPAKEKNATTMTDFARMTVKRTSRGMQGVDLIEVINLQGQILKDQLDA